MAGAGQEGAGQEMLGLAVAKAGREGSEAGWRAGKIAGTRRKGAGASTGQKGAGQEGAGASSAGSETRGAGSDCWGVKGTSSSGGVRDSRPRKQTIQKHWSC